MISEFAPHLTSGPAADIFWAAATSGEGIATKVRDFVAPIAAVLIGVMSLRYVFGDQRSLAGFVGFLLLGIVVYVLIKYGTEILGAFGDIFRSFLQ